MIDRLAAGIIVTFSLALTSCGGGGGARPALPQLVAGDAHTVAIKANGTLWAWGWNNHGELGNGSTSDSDTPVQVGTDADWQTVSAGYFHTVAIKKNGTL
jgi:alpha-tubulin suppressor-like RCC1 family protein